MTPARLKQIRREAGMSISQLAKLFGRSERFLRRLEAGTKELPDDVLDMYAELTLTVKKGRV